MDQLACVNVLRLPLQIEGIIHPETLLSPTVLLDKDSPNGKVLMANRAARRKGLKKGMRYAEALSLESSVHACISDQKKIKTYSDKILKTLLLFSPEVEVSTELPGIFWLNADGLLSIFPSLKSWGSKIHQALSNQGFLSRINVGFTKFFTTAHANIQKEPVRVFSSASEEMLSGQKISIQTLNFPPKLSSDLAKLGVATLGQFVQIPSGELLKRYGKKAQAIHQLASKQTWQTIKHDSPKKKFVQHKVLDNEVWNAQSLLFLIKRQLHPLLKDLAKSYVALGSLSIKFSLDNQSTVTEVIVPSEPSLDEKLLLGLVRLRIEALSLPSPAVEIRLTATYAKATKKQLSLWQTTTRRNPQKAAEALAAIRSMLGNHSVLSIQLGDGHLPEKQYQLVETTSLKEAKPLPPSYQRLRRIYTRPLLLPCAPQSDKVLLHQGPYIFDDQWWNQRVSRHYYFTETSEQRCLWTYWDAVRNRWYLHGVVE